MNFITVTTVFYGCVIFICTRELCIFAHLFCWCFCFVLSRLTSFSVSCKIRLVLMNFLKTSFDKLLTVITGIAFSVLLARRFFSYSHKMYQSISCATSGLFWENCYYTDGSSFVPDTTFFLTDFETFFNF